MEIGIQRIFLALAVLSSPAVSADALSLPVETERRQLDHQLIDTEDFEIGIGGGILSIEDFESSTWFSGHIGYHLSESFYLKARYGQSEGGDTSFEELVNAAPLLTDEQRELRYYGLSLGYNLLPGEVFLSPTWAFNSVLSLEAGAGNTDFGGDERLTAHAGVNYRLYLTDWLAWDLQMTDYVFRSNLTGKSKITHNFNFATGLAIYF
ncbi:outer membrane beta-barrel domain-containing protein [Ferrimonas senticii]|uniref:outer membrane beta-barrel domain-containing protein n=1 Tax=Ferrimonas senticii TaxID=394566 RepID=UPI0003F9000C|nr:outer membrane beta-barrel domain-containing protein [Ferrimonas senticii]